jgi:hypothetical protein
VNGAVKLRWAQAREFMAPMVPRPARRA